MHHLVRQSQELENNKMENRVVLRKIDAEVQQADRDLKEVAEKLKNCARQQEPIQV